MANTGDLAESVNRLVANVHDYAIFTLSPQGIVTTWNAGAERIKGYTRQEIIGRHFSEFYEPEAVATGWPDRELELAAANGHIEDEGWRVRKDGSRFWANVVITALHDSNGELSGYLKITRDLTERKRAEEKLRQSEERFRLLVEQVKDYAIFMLDPEGRIVSWNSGAERIKGYSANEIIGQHFSVFYSSEDVAAGKPERELEIARRDGSVEDEGWRVRKDRSLFWANAVISAVRDESGELIGFTKVTRDMTERRNAEALELADRQKNEFLAMLAHELRNPLAPISNGLELLKLSGIDEVTVEQTRAMMERQVRHLGRLVDDLLDVARVITGKLSQHKEPLEVATVIARAVESSQSLIDARGHELVVTMPARSIIVDADLHRLAQVVGNLLINAAKYTDHPSQIRLTVERDDGEVLIRVIDQGIGIDPRMLPEIFRLFVQADDSLARSRGGLGIGLSVVKQITEQHGGSVQAHSAGLGKGSEFVVRLPISHATPASSGPAPALAGAVPRRRILVVDDNVDAAVTISSLLRAKGHDVHTVYNGPAALNAVKAFHPEILLLDIGLPGMSGYDVARQLRSEPSAEGIVIIALTGYGQEADRRRSFEAGFDYHLTKPPDPTILESLLLSPQVRAQDSANN